MHIPRQADRSGPARTDGAGTGLVTGPDAGPVTGPDGLRARRRHLVQQLRAVVYWQRLVQARTDLLVAGLLYTSPVPGPGRLWLHDGADPLAGLVWGLVPGAEDRPEDRAEAPDGTGEDPSDLHALGRPPEGMDLDRLLEQIAAPVTGAAGTGEHLARLRATAAVLAGHRSEVQEDLDGVTSTLHEHLAADGAEEATLATR